MTDFQIDETENARILSIDVANLNASEIVEGLAEEGGFNLTDIEEATKELKEQKELEEYVERNGHYPRGYKGGNQ